jgi:hypothetical protein
MAKDNKKKKNDVKKPATTGISLSDVKDANSKAAATLFPDAPKKKVEAQVPQGQAPQQEEEAFKNDEVIPPDAPIAEAIENAVEEAVVEAVVEAAVEAMEAVVDDNIVGVAPPVMPPAPVIPPVVVKPPSQDDLEEKSLENWWNTKNKPTEINHFELAYSGVNLSNFGMLEAKVGKFRFKRNYIGESWTISIEDKI